MFEFDEHFSELEAMESEMESFDPQDNGLLPVWAYVGNGVWKLDFEADALHVSQDWLLNTADVT